MLDARPADVWCNMHFRIWRETRLELEIDQSPIES
jgi:hypothetical protein